MSTSAGYYSEFLDGSDFPLILHTEEQKILVYLLISINKKKKPIIKMEMERSISKDNKWEIWPTTFGLQQF